MWQGFEKRIEENEREGNQPLRMALWEVFRSSNLRPGEGATKKMLSFQFGRDERLLWELTGAARNVFLLGKWRPTIENSGLDCQPRRYVPGKPFGGRHSALSANWSFGEEDCIAIPLRGTGDLRNLLDALQDTKAALILKPEAISRWIVRLREFFPDLHRFDRPDPDFDSRERDYKLEFTDRLKVVFETCETPISYLDAFLSETKKQLNGQKYNLIDWRPLDLIAKHSMREDMGRAIVNFLNCIESDPVDDTKIREFMQEMSDAWSQGNQSSWDPARQVAEAIAFHLCPQQAIFFRRGVLDPFFEEATGSKFPRYDDPKESYAEELRFARSVYKAFEERGLAPRDMIDVQSALWVVHNYKDELLTRKKIEAAMDAYEGYLKTGEGSEIFNGFKQPKDFWVRSTRSRPNRVFPSKPIVAHALGVEQLNGGWSTGASAAAALHNAGYIIVDQDDQPVPIPPDKPFLLIDADRIRACALNYYISPAREQGEAQASIRAGTLNNELMLKEAWPNVCQALKGGKFQELAGVPEPTQEGPDASTTTIFTYALGANMQVDIVTDTPQETTPSATNLILYGPPGTGKTYETAWEAVRLCLGEAAAKPLRGPEHRSALMKEYRQLVAAGRVAFITFHQSMSYEEFVEGLRPETQGAEEQELVEDTSGSGGFRLKVEDGIFKRFSERARLDVGAEGAAQRLERTLPIFKVALGRRFQEEDQIRDALDAGEIRHGWSGQIDWSEDRFEDWSQIKSELESKSGKEVSAYSGEIVCTYSFRSDMQVGDYVVVSDGRDKMRAFGKIASDYFFEADTDHHPHRRKVDWIWRDDQGVDRASFYSNGFRQHSVYKLNGTQIDWDGLEKIVFSGDRSLPLEGARPHVLIIDEINRANISKVFGELITLLEADKRLGNVEHEIRLTLPYSKKSFGVPPNLHIIGTMNTADRSIALLDTALRRRFNFRELMPDPKVLSADVAGIDLQKLLTRINERIEYLFDREHQIGHAYFTNCHTLADIEAVMRDNIIPLLAEYFYEDWSKIAAVLEGRPVTAEGNFDGRFLRGRHFVPVGFEDDENNVGNRLRWSLKEKLDFSEFKAV